MSFGAEMSESSVYLAFCDVVILQATRGLYLAIRCLYALVLGGPVSFEGVEAPALSCAGLSFAASERCVPVPGPCLQNVFPVLCLQPSVASLCLHLANLDLFVPAVPGFLASFVVLELLAVAAARVLVLAVVAAGFLVLAAGTPEVLVFAAVALWIRAVVSDGSGAAPGRLDAVPGELAVVLDGCVVALDKSAVVPAEGVVEAPGVGVAALGGLALVAHDGIFVVAPG